MRIIGELDDAKLAARFSRFLKNNGIDNHTEGGVIWVESEDFIDQGRRYLEEFQKNPTDQKFDTSDLAAFPKDESEEAEKELLLQEALLRIKPIIPQSSRKKRAAGLTGFFFLLCACVYAINLMQVKWQKNEGQKWVFMTGIESLLLYDLSSAMVGMNEVVVQYNLESDQKLSDMPPAAASDMLAAEALPSWDGIYPYLVTHGQVLPGSSAFFRIGEGQVWRIISPCFLHRDFFHFLFNMLWLWFLGKQIEEKTTRMGYLVLVLLIGAVSNTAQYLMSGPYFLGYSGVVCGLAGFIWARQKRAPWEGYLLQRSTILFLGFYVLAMLFLQVASFFAQLLSSTNFVPGIANTAHIAGALCGALLGWYFPFSRRGHEQ